jgi:small-conductance mechanosensitive channel
MREMLQAGLKELGTRLDSFSAAHAKIQRSLVTRDKALLMLITKVRDEQAQAYDELKTAHEGQVKAAAEQTKAYQELATAYDEQAKAYEELFRQNSAANLTLKSLTTQSQESLPDRKVALRPGRGASR